MATIAPDRPQAQSTIKVIDADTHLTEPWDLWTSRAPAKWRDRVPQVKMHDGAMSWVIDGDKVIGLKAHPNSAIRADGSKVRKLDEFLALEFDDVHIGSSDLAARLRVMDETGIHAQIVYPNILGFGGQAAAKVDPDLRQVCVEIYNDAMAEMQEASGGRFFPMALLPWWDVKAAVKETERTRAMGLRGININSDPHYHEDADGRLIPDLASPHWDPLWDACSSLGMPVNFHIGASEQSMDWIGQQGWPSLTRDLRSGLGGAMLFFNNGRVVANIIYSGLLDRFPRIRFVSVESGVGWVPFMMEAIDYQLVEIAEGRKFAMKPSEYFKQNFYACFWFEQDDIAHTLRRVGIDNCLFETDFPHPTGLYPIERLEDRLGDLTFEERDKVLSRNAAKLYRIGI
ncbi:amidohydrolase [Novosphingobium sp. PC22D]|uniref:amidohydrolase family protein n=1 Tax=Novosphingobium sp. PC22D TaxID=1962403 RepID=UPI000BF0E33C|nr:amidohydrolase family protein [Novosphingobium sp. PC22D]PEQ13060.1 amidohydrolase [Novosphingobium sp. PC22D]